MRALPLFYPTPCMPSPYSIPGHAYPPPVLSQSMHTLPLFYPSPCIPSPCSIPIHAWPPPILSLAMHTHPRFYPSCAYPPLFYPRSAYLPYSRSLSLSHITGNVLLWHLSLLNLLPFDHHSLTAYVIIYKSSFTSKLTGIWIINSSIWYFGFLSHELTIRTTTC